MEFIFKQLFIICDFEETILFTETCKMCYSFRSNDFLMYEKMQHYDISLVPSTTTTFHFIIASLIERKRHKLFKNELENNKVILTTNLSITNCEKGKRLLDGIEQGSYDLKFFLETKTPFLLFPLYIYFKTRKYPYEELWLHKNLLQQKLMSEKMHGCTDCSSIFCQWLYTNRLLENFSFTIQDKVLDFNTFCKYGPFGMDNPSLKRVYEHYQVQNTDKNISKNRRFTIWT